MNEVKAILPLRFFLITIGGVFLAEVVAMIILQAFRPLPFYIETLTDAMIMTVMVFPVLYLLSFRPLITQIDQRRHAEDALRSAHDNLEIRVQERTQELASVNESLQVEISERRLVEAELQKTLLASEQRKAEISALLEAARAVLEQREFPSAARAIFDACKHLVGASAGYIALVKDEFNEAVFLDAGGYPCSVDPALGMPIRGFREQAYRSGETVYDNRFREGEWVRLLPAGHASLENVLFAPLKINSEVVGLMGLGNKPGGFSENDAKLATAFGEMTAVALLNSRAHDTLLNARQDLERRVQQRTQELAQANLELQAEIAEREHAESQLRLLSAALESAANGVIITGKRGNIRWANPAFAQMTGYTIEEVIGQNPRLLKSSQHGEVFYDNLWSTILSGQVWHGETINRRKDGSLYVEEQTITPLLDKQGEITHFIAIKQDITKRKQAEQALQENEERHRKILDTLPVGVWLVDGSGKVLYGNEADQQIWAGPRQMGIEQYREHKGWYTKTGIGIEPEGWAILKALKHGEITLNDEIEIECFDGTHKIILNSALPVRDDQQQIVGAFVVNQDITERKRFEQQLERSNHDLFVLSAAERKQRELAEGLVHSVIALSSSLQLEDVLNVILDQIRRAIPFRGGSIVLIEGNTYRVAGFRGFEDFPDTVVAIKKSYAIKDFPIFQQICATFQPVVIHDTAEEANWRVIPGMEWVRSYLAVPLISDGQVTGIINLSSERPGYFVQETLERIMTFAAPAGLALHNAQLYKAELTARRASETLRAAAQALTQTLDLDRVINTLLEHIGAMTHSDMSGVALFEGETRLTIRAVRGSERWTNLDQLQSIQLDANFNAALHSLISTRKSILVPDTATFSGWQALPGLEPIRSWLAVPLVASDKVIGVVGLGKIEASYFTHEHIKWSEALVGQAAMAVQNAWLFEQVHTGHERLQSLSRRLVEIQESERRYISRELHDEAGQALSSLIYTVCLLEQEAEDPERVLARSSELKQVTDSVLENLHRLAMDLRPASLDHLGLEAALQQFIQSLRERSHLEIRLKSLGSNNERLSPEAETTLYRIVQEALTNVIRHAQATHVDIVLEQGADKVTAIVEDNGNGFEIDKLASSGHMGLMGMQERAEMLGGRLEIESEPGMGTTIFVEVPYGSSHPDRG